MILLQQNHNFFYVITEISRNIAHVFLFQCKEVVPAVEHLVFLAGDDHEVGVLGGRGEPDVDLEVLHDLKVRTVQFKDEGLNCSDKEG